MIIEVLGMKLVASEFEKVLNNEKRYTIRLIDEYLNLYLKSGYINTIKFYEVDELGEKTDRYCYVRIITINIFDNRYPSNSDYIEFVCEKYGINSNELKKAFKLYNKDGSENFSVFHFTDSYIV